VPFQSSHEVTVLLRGWRRGDAAALDKLMPLVYDELHRLAHRYMVREQAGHTLQTTALINEAYLRLIDARQVECHRSSKSAVF
jgi:RNA polymerase sigma-70 factor (ECF subfamily)